MARLIIDARFREQFRRDPRVARRPYGLSRAELEALKSGSERRLHAAGADLDALFAPDLVRALLAPRGAGVPFDLLTGGRPAPRSPGRSRASSARKRGARGSARSAPSLYSGHAPT